MEDGVLRNQIFPLVSGRDLAACICVCRQWRDVGRDDLLWRRLCEIQWPSTCASPAAIGAERGYRNLFSTLTASKNPRAAPPVPRLQFQDLEFYIDVWVKDRSVYSAIVSGPIVQSGIRNLPAGICGSLQQHLESNQYKMTVPVTPAFEVTEHGDETHMTMVARRRDRNLIATIIHGSRFSYVDAPEQRAHAFDFLNISPLFPFVSNIRAWVALLMVENERGRREVFGIELDFLDTASSDDEVLCLLDILDWK